MQSIPRLAALGFAVPAHTFDQEEVVECVKRLFAGAAELDRLLPVFANSSIRRRFSSVPLDWFEKPHGWAERNRRYRDTALDLLEIAAGRALDCAGMTLPEIGAVVVVSTTGIATPSLDALLIERMRFSPTVTRLPIFGLGCAGGVLGIARAATLAAAMPKKGVLLLVVELCSLTFRRDDVSKSNIVGAALFGDGVAAALLHCDSGGPGVLASGEHTWPESLDIMGWEVMQDGLKPAFSRNIPRLVAEKLGSVARDFLGRHGLAIGDIDRFVCHPGGPKVIDAMEVAFGLAPGTLRDARAVLRDYGNMSAASVLFVLDRMLAGDETWDRALLTALGPGFTGGFVVLAR